MTDKVQKIREEVARIQAYTQSDVLKEVLDYIDKVQKEPVSEELEEAAKEWLRLQLDKSYANYGEVKMMELTHFDGYAMLDAIEFGAEWQKTKDESTTEDLGDYINELSKQFPEVSFANLIRIAVRVAKWKEQQLMANAVEGVVHHFEKCKVASVHYNDPTGVPMAYFTSPEGLSAGDKVKINVIKKD